MDWKGKLIIEEATFKLAVELTDNILTLTLSDYCSCIIYSRLYTK